MFTTVLHSENSIRMVNCLKKIIISQQLINYLILLVQSGASICEMMFCSSLVATAGSGESSTTSPRRVNIINTKVRRKSAFY